jgi:hypothetical protein
LIKVKRDEIVIVLNTGVDTLELCSEDPIIVTMMTLSLALNEHQNNQGNYFLVPLVCFAVCRGTGGGVCPLGTTVDPH